MSSENSKNTETEDKTPEIKESLYGKLHGLSGFDTETGYYRNRQPRQPRRVKPPWLRKKRGRPSHDEMEKKGTSPIFASVNGIPYRDHVICSMLASGSNVAECATMFNLKPASIRKIAKRNKSLMDDIARGVTRAIQNAAAVQMYEKLSSDTYVPYPIRSKRKKA